MIGQSTLPQVFTSFVPQVVRRVAKLDDHAAEVLDRLVSGAAPMWHHPSAFYFGGVDLTGDGRCQGWPSCATPGPTRRPWPSS